MKTIYHYLIALTAILIYSSCNNEWENELYKNAISFAQNGLQDVHVRYKTDGKVTYRLPIVVSGSRENEKDYLVKVAVDKDTLNTMNFERYRYRDDLYFKYLDEQFWSAPKEVAILAGQNTANLDIDFTLSGINMSQHWVLPLTIVDDPSYEANHRKHYRKALLNIIPFNDYSGKYGATAGLVYNKAFGGLNDKNPQNMANRTCYVVDENSVFFYAGLTEEELQNRELYKINATFTMNDYEDEDGSISGYVVLSAPNADKIGFKQISGTVNIKKEMDAVILDLEHKYIKLALEYEYTYLIPNSSAKIDYIFKGNMTMERKRYMNIPDEDQAIIW